MKQSIKSLKEMKSPKPTDDLEAMVIGDGAFRQDMSGCWLETHDIEGHRPLFKIQCQFHPDTPMTMRYSHITPRNTRVTKLLGLKDIIEYKCMKCGLVEKFYIDTSKEYLDKLRERRFREGYRDLYYPRDKWEEDKQTKQQLSALGYCGGREDV